MCVISVSVYYSAFQAYRYRTNTKPTIKELRRRIAPLPPTANYNISTYKDPIIDKPTIRHTCGPTYS